MKRVYSASVLTAFQPHFNHSVGKYVRSMREFKDALNQGSDEMSNRLGHEHRYVPLESGEAPGVTEEGLDSQKRERRRVGYDERKRSYF